MKRRSLLHGLLASLIAPKALGYSLDSNRSTSLGPLAATLPDIETDAIGKSPGVAGHINTGFKDLDNLLGELRDGSLIAIASRPAMGKTCLALAIAAHVAVNLHRPVAVFGAPLSEQEIRARMTASLARVDLWAAKQILSQSDASPVMLALQALASAPLLIDDRPFLNMGDLSTKVFWNNAQSGLRNGLTVVLAPELLEVEATKPHRQSESCPLGGALVEMSKTFGGAVLCELPLGRAVEERDDKWPRLTDMVGFSRVLARDADAILLLYREAIYDADAPLNEAFITAVRNRFGPRGTTMLAFTYDGGFADYVWPI